MKTYTIGETAERSGFSASALRYYEGIGLVTPAQRTDAGYRLYDDDTIARLDFIARAKQLGCSLEEITDLVEIWDGERCGPVQRRFHDLVSAKIRGARQQIAELSTFAAQLQIAAAQLSEEPIDGPCGDDCACLATPEAAKSVGFGRLPTDVPIACTLDGGSVSGRIADWQVALAAAARHSTTGDGALRIEFDDAVDIPTLAALIADEQRCCAFLSFALTIDDRGIGLEVRAPEGASDIVSALFGYE